MKLTKQQAIKEHRKMWNWIADETERQKRCVSKVEYLEKYIKNYRPYKLMTNAEFYKLYESLRNDCYLCEYVSSLHQHDDICIVNEIDCNKCPLDWDSGCCCAHRARIGEFILWEFSISHNDYKSAAAYAQIIANLKEK